MTVRIPSLALSRDLLVWLQEDASWQNLDWRLRGALAWKATWSNINIRLSQAQQLHAVARENAIAPVLILGPWRSGTTVMHELLTAATGLATPRTWQCMSPATFQLSRAPRGKAVVARPMDGLEIGAMSPQEDEFALLALGLPSAYRAFWQPNRIDELCSTLDPHFWKQNPLWLSSWELFLRGVINTTPGASEMLILKSPNHTYRLPAISQRFKQTRVVWMARPAAQVFFSNRKMWRAMFAQHGLPGSRATEATLDRFLAQALNRAAQVLEWCLDALSVDQWAIVEQSRLRNTPDVVTMALCRQLGLPSVTGTVPLEKTLKRIAQGRVDQYEHQALPGAAMAACRRLDDVQAIALHRVEKNKDVFL